MKINRSKLDGLETDPNSNFITEMIHKSEYKEHNKNKLILIKSDCGTVRLIVLKDLLKKEIWLNSRIYLRVRI